MELIIGCGVMSISLLIIGSILFEKKLKINVKTIICLIMITCIVTQLNMTEKNIITNILKVMVLFVVFVVSYKIIYNNRISKTIMASFIAYLIYFIAEVFIDTIMYIIFYLLNIDDVFLMQNTIIINTVVPIITVIITFLLRKKIKELLKEENIDNKILIAISVLILFTLSLLIFEIPIAKLKLDFKFLTTMILLILFCIIGFVLVKQRTETQKITDRYTKLASYAQENEGLLEEYRVNLHESKNQLIIIDNMIPKKYKEIHEYIEERIEKCESNKYYWLTELKYVPLSELKGFMNFKIMEMMNKGIDVEIVISREIKQQVFKNYKVKDKENLYSIVGVLLDNAKEASLESKEKQASIQMYMEKKDIKLIIANTYKGKINIEKIDEYGYSSKGANRGTGLHIVNGIVDTNPLFEKETSILDNYFVQTITIHPKEKKK